MRKCKDCFYFRDGKFPYCVFWSTVSAILNVSPDWPACGYAFTLKYIDMFSKVKEDKKND